MADIRCPMCSRENPEEQDTCLFCGARLTPVLPPSSDDPGSIRPGEQPVKKETAEFERVFPTSGSKAPIPAGEMPTKKETGELERTLPSWLQALRQGQESGDASTAGDSQEDKPVDFPIDAEPSSSEGDFLDGLSGLGDGKAEEGELPDWLAGLQTQKEDEVKETPDWLADIRQPEPERPIETEKKEGIAPSDETTQEGEDDWLSRLGGSTPETTQETPVEPIIPMAEPVVESNEVPALQDMQQPEEIPQIEDVAPAAEPAESIPAWLQGDKVEVEHQPEQPLESAVTEPAQEDEFPDWLANLGGIPTTPEVGEGTSSGEEVAATPAEDMPSWMSAIHTEKPLEDAAILGGAGTSLSGLDQELPDWLANLEPPVQETPSDETPTAALPAEELPDWLSMQQGKEIPAGGTTADQVTIEGSEESISPILEPEPDWLSKLKAEGQAREEAEKEFQPATEPLPAEPAAPETIPDWLTGIETSDSTSNATPALILDGNEASSRNTEGAFSMENPEWLTAIKPDEGVKKPFQAESSAEKPEELSTAELPSWVQAMRPVESVVGDAGSVEVEDSAPETQGPLAGLRGVLPAGLGVIPTKKPASQSTKLQVSENQQRTAAQLEKMILEEGERPQVAAATRIQPTRLLRWVLSAVLILAVLLPTMSGLQVAPALIPINQPALVGLVNGLQTNSPVLVVFDYEPALSAELEAASSPLIDHLILVTGARLTLVSTSPTGPILAEKFFRETESQHNYLAGQQYVNLGYLAGGPAGVLSFSMNPQSMGDAETWSLPPMQGIQKLSDYAALIILTDDPDTGRVWIEQSRVYLGQSPMIMVISAQAEPLIQPYYDSGQIQGLVTGLAGGDAYEQSLPKAGAGLAQKYWSSFSIGSLIAVILIAAGGLWSLVLAWRERQADRKGKR